MIDNESQLSIYDDILAVAKESATSKGLTFEADTILTVLENELGSEDEINIHPFELCEGLQKALNRKTVSPEWIATRLRRLGFKKNAEKPRDERGVVYTITKAEIDQIRCRYETPEETYRPTYSETYMTVSK